MRRPYAPAYEAYTHFGASAEDASAEDASAEEEVTAAITTRKKVIRDAQLTPVPSSKVPYRGPSELTFKSDKSDGDTHTLRLTYIASGTYNIVYGVEGTTVPLILRVSFPTVDDEDAEDADADDDDDDDDDQETKRAERAERAEQREEDKRQARQDQRTELKFMRRMGDLGIGPRVYASVLFADAGADAPMTGIFMEKLEMSLSDAESCPYLTRRTFVDADAESALVDLYARSSRVFECIDTKSPNVLFTPGDRAGPNRDARIAMIDMDATFCREATLTKTPPTGIERKTTIEDLEARLPGLSGLSGIPGRSGNSTSFAVISLLVHCIVSMRKAAYGFPYPRVAACLYNNWTHVWPLVLRHKPIRADGYSASYMVAHYHFKNGNIDLQLYDRGTTLRSAIAQALRAPMTRILLMTRGLDVSEDGSDQIRIVRSGTVVSGDMYVRLARVHDTTHGVDREMRDALDAHNRLDALNKLERSRESSELFVCRASEDKGDLRCRHATGAPFREAPSIVKVRYSDAVYSESAPKWSDALSIETEKRLPQLDRVETALLLCHFMNSVNDGGRDKTHYSIARSIYKLAQWTGADLARMIKKPDRMKEQLMSFSIPKKSAAKLVNMIGDYIRKDVPIPLIPPCADSHGAAHPFSPFKKKKTQWQIR